MSPISDNLSQCKEMPGLNLLLKCQAASGLEEIFQRSPGFDVLCQHRAGKLQVIAACVPLRSPGRPGVTFLKRMHFLKPFLFFPPLINWLLPFASTPSPPPGVPGSDSDLFCFKSGPLRPCSNQHLLTSVLVGAVGQISFHSRKCVGGGGLFIPVIWVPPPHPN